jgi:hypothetical protein
MSKELKKHQDYNDGVTIFLIVGIVVLSTITVLNLIIQW